MEMTLEYWNALAHQTTLIASLLSGFSIAVVAHMIVSDKKDRLTTMILKAATLSAGCFLVAVFAMIQISMATTPGGYLKDVVAADFLIPRAIGIFTFITGLFSLTVMISLSGWSKSKKVGVFTTIVGVLTLLLILITMTRINF
jgi:hypothetical protein